MLHPEPPDIGYLKSAEAAARSLEIKLVGLEVRSSTEIERAFATFAGEPHNGLIIAPNFVSLRIATSSSGRFRRNMPCARACRPDMMDEPSLQARKR
jgi:hypothetical protein